MASLFSRAVLAIIRPALALHEQRQAEDRINDERLREWTEGMKNVPAEQFHDAIRTQVAGNSSDAYREQMRMERAGEKPLRATED